MGPSWHRAMRNQVIYKERRPVPATRQELVAELAACADPARAELGLSRLFETVPDAQERLRASPTLARTVITVMAASPFLTRTCVTEPMALDVLAQLDVPLAPLAPLSRWKGLELLRIAARDLSGEIPLEAVGSAPWPTWRTACSGRPRPARAWATTWPWWRWASSVPASSTTAATSTSCWWAGATPTPCWPWPVKRGAQTWTCAPRAVPACSSAAWPLIRPTGTAGPRRGSSRPS